MTAEDIRIRLGEYDFARSNETRTQDFEVVDIRTHLDFSFQTYENDIAIVKLHRRTVFNSYVWPVCLPPPGPNFENMTAVVIGKTLENSLPYSNDSNDVSHQMCGQFWELNVEDVQ
jgi:hypothetical protein